MAVEPLNPGSWRPEARFDWWARVPEWGSARRGARGVEVKLHGDAEVAVGERAVEDAG
jgi:hypothetical protein